MRKARKFLGFCITLCLVFGLNGAWAAYTCDDSKEYTTCNNNYYLSNKKCLACSSASNTTTTKSCEVDCTKPSVDSNAVNVTWGTEKSTGTQTCNGYYQTGNGSGGSGGASAQCTGCSSYNSTCNITSTKTCTYKITSCKSGYTPSSDGQKCEVASCGSGEYLDGTCKTCPTGYTSDGGSGGISSCYITIGAGKYKTSANGTATSSCPNWTYIDSHKSYYGSSDSCSNSCPDVTSGWNKAAGTGWTKYSDCYQTQTPAGCASGTVKQNATGTNTWGSTTLNSRLYASSGYYASATATSCSSCPTGYTSDASATAQSECFVNVTGGHYIGTAGQYASTWQTCAAGTYKEAHKVYYGNTSSCSPCSSGQTSGAGASACSTGNCNKGEYVKNGVCTACTGNDWSNGGSATSCTTCPDGTTVKSDRSGCGNLTCAAGTGVYSVSGGVWDSSNNRVSACSATCSAGSYKPVCDGVSCSCSSCTGETYSTNDNTLQTCNSCGTNASANSAHTSCSCNSCTGGTEVSGCTTPTWTSPTSCTGYTATCSGGYANPTCTGTNCSCTGCLAGTYSAGGTATKCETCDNWTYSHDYASSCTNCPQLTSGWSKKDATSIGWTNYDMCVQITTPENCLSGTIKQVAASSSLWGASQPDTTLTAKPGWYPGEDGLSCPVCPAGKVCDGTWPLEECPENSFCPDGSSKPIECKTLGDGKWSFSDGGAEKDYDCYTMCANYSIEHGDAGYVHATENYPEVCTYTANCTDAGYVAKGNNTTAPSCEANPSAFTVTYNMQGGAGCTSKSFGPETGVTNDCVPTLKAKTFVGWYDAANGGNKIDCVAGKFSSGACANKYDSNVTLFAHWEACPKGHVCPDDGAEFACPEPKLLAAVKVYTEAEGASDIEQCKAQLSYIDEPKHICGGYQICSYMNATEDYTNCGETEIQCCDAGYWLDPAEPMECSVAGYGYYSSQGDLESHLCPEYTDSKGATTTGNTDGDTSASREECFAIGIACNITNGAGSYARCDYSVATRSYSICETKSQCLVDECDESFQMVGNSCIVCPANSICIQPVPEECKTNPSLSQCQPQTCSSLTGGQYTKSDAGLTDVSECYRDCDMPANANGVQGRDYQGIPDTCEATSCESGYYLESGACEECPAGYYCPGGKEKPKKCSPGKYCPDGSDEEEECPAGFYCEDPANPTPCPEGSYCPEGSAEPKLCSDLKPQAQMVLATVRAMGYSSTWDNVTVWDQSPAQSDSPEDCYANCVASDLEYGVSVPTNATENYPTECSFTCVSATGNPGKIVGGRCQESQCKSDMEMLNGVCEYCERENALTYKPGSNCMVEMCVAGYHPSGKECVPDEKECDQPHATRAHHTWDARANAFGACMVDECEEGYHIASNTCILDEESCVVPHGRGTHEWNHNTNSWGPCHVSYCEPGYTNDPGLTNELTEGCGQCKNKFSVLGEQAVSSYTRECEIASCMYQGDIYNLNKGANECEPICIEYEDETGSQKRVGNKCVRTCFEGYSPWN